MDEEVLLNIHELGEEGQGECLTAGPGGRNAAEAVFALDEAGRPQLIRKEALQEQSRTISRL